MAVSINWGVLSVGVLLTRALLFEICIVAPDVWKLACRFWLLLGRLRVATDWLRTLMR